MRDEIERFRQANVTPFGVNPATVAAHAAYVAKLKLPFALISDANRAMTRSYGALRPDGRSVERTVYLIGRAGAIRFGRRWMPSTEEVLAAL